jgi:hypothetical protein
MGSPGWVKQLKAQAPPERRGPPDSLRYVNELPAAVFRDMRTIDPRLSTLEPGPSAADLVRLAIPLVDEIKLAALDKFEQGRTRLVYAERQNQLTGAWGIVVSRWYDGGAQSRPFAELICTDDELTPETIEKADGLGWCASNRRLSLAAYQGPSEDGSRRFVLLIGRFGAKRRDRQTTNCLARMLVTPYEVAQWRESDERFLH